MSIRVIILFAFLFIQKLEFGCGSTLVGYSNVSCLDSEKIFWSSSKVSLMNQTVYHLGWEMIVVSGIELFAAKKQDMSLNSTFIFLIGTTM